MNANPLTEIKDTTANPAPLGLLAFGMTTVLLNLHNAGLTALDSVILAMGLFFGGSAQVIAGVQEWKKGNTFGATAFTSYGMFWLTLVGVVTLPHLVTGVAPANSTAMAVYLAIWGVFTAGLFLGTLRLNRALQVVFATLTVLFFLLAAAEHLGNPSLTHLAGWEGIVCGASAMYAGFAVLLNEVYGRVVLPVGTVAASVPLPAIPARA